MDNYASERVRRLNELNIKPDKGPAPMKKVSITEKGVNYTVDARESDSVTIYPIDGVLIKEGLRCDKLITIFKDDIGIALFLELKGGNISHAIDQLESTIRHPLFLPYPSKKDKTRARIISSRGVKSASKVKYEDAKIRFRKIYNVDLKLLSNLQPDDVIRFY